MKLTLKRMTTVLLALIMMLIFIPAMTVYADENVDSAKVTILAVKDAYGLEVLKDVDVPADAATKAGYQVNAEYASKVTIADAIVVLHQKIYGEAFNADPTKYLTMSNGTIKTFFERQVGTGKEIADMMFYVNDQYPEYADQPGTGSVADDTVLSDGDTARIFALFSEYLADNYLVFDWKDKEGVTSDTFTIKVSSFWATSLGQQEPEPLEGVKLSIRDASGDEVKEATTDENGNASFTIGVAGDYSIVAKSIPEDELFEEDFFISDYAELNVKNASQPTDAQANISFTMSVKGDLKVVDKPVTVKDADEDGALTINDAFIEAHKAYAPNGAEDYAFGESSYGPSIKKLWGDTSGLFGYYLNDQMAYGPTDPIADGDMLYGMVYQNAYPDTESYAFFDKKEVTSKEGEEVSLELKYSSGWDENWNPVYAPLAGASVGYNQDGAYTELGKTDNNGKVTFTISAVGQYSVTAVAPEGTSIVPPFCSVTVKKNPTTDTCQIQFTASVKGDLKVVDQPVTVKDSDEDGALTINDALIEAHKAYAPNGEADYGYGEGSYGLEIQKLWGDTSKLFSYYVNDQMPYGLTEAITDGDALYAFVLKNAYPDTESYSYFDKKDVTCEAGEEVSLELKYSSGWDENWAPVYSPLAGASVGYYKDNNFVELGKTDANGKVTFAISEAGDYAVTAVGPEGTEIVPPYCAVTVTEAEVAPAPITPAPTVVKGKTYKKGGQSFKVTKAAKGKTAGTVTFTKAKNAKNVTVPATVKLADNKTYKVTVVGAKAFTGKKIRTVTIGKNVTKIKAKAFAKSKATKMIIKTKKLKNKASVKGSLKGSKIKTVKVKAGKKFVKKYKKFFTRKNAGKKVKVS